MQKRDKTSKFEYMHSVFIDNDNIDFISNFEPIIDTNWVTYYHAVVDDIDDDGTLRFPVNRVIALFQNKGEFGIEDLSD